MALTKRNDGSKQQRVLDCVLAVSPTRELAVEAEIVARHTGEPLGSVRGHLYALVAKGKLYRVESNRRKRLTRTGPRAMFVYYARVAEGASQQSEAPQFTDAALLAAYGVPKHITQRSYACR